MNTQTISVFGLGKLGATMVGCFASAGFNVIGVDISKAAVDQVDAGVVPVAEPGLQAMYDANREKIHAVLDAREAVLHSDASFIIVPTPSLPSGEFDDQYALQVAGTIGKALAEKTSYHLVVLTSTLLPGACDGRMIPALEAASGKTCGKDFGFCYSPEFIAIGNVIDGLLNPDFFLIGEQDERAGQALESIYRAEAGEAACVIRMGIVNAELTKISVNAFVTGKISFANTLAQICAKLPGGNARVVADAVGRDQRIGRKYLRPGATFGGPCFPRDNRAFSWVAQSLGLDAPLAAATDEINRRHIEYLAGLVSFQHDRPFCIGLLGLSYKPHTNLMEESLGAGLARYFLATGATVVAYDPRVTDHGVTEKISGLELLSSMQDVVDRADALYIATDHEEFDALPDIELKNLTHLTQLIDIWGCYCHTPLAGLTCYRDPCVYQKF